MNPLKKEAGASRQLLTDQQIGFDGPGTILRDVETMLSFIGTAGLPSKSKRGNLPMEVLSELNQRFSQPLKLTLDRPLLQDYPNLAGVYVLLRVMDLVRADKGRVWVDEEALNRWLRLNPTERYFALLEAWLLDAQNAVLGTDDHRLWGQFESNVRFLSIELSTSRFKSFPEYCHTLEACGCVSTWNTQLQVLFGLIDVKERPLKKRKRGGSRGWIMQKARRTPWGEAVAWGIWEAMKPEDEMETPICHLPEDATYGFLQPGFQLYFPEWQRTFAPIVPVSQPGVFIIKASLEGAWCRLAVQGDSMLDDLAVNVLGFFKFDNDHLYEMSYRDNRGRQRRYYHSYCDDGPYGHEILLAESGWPVKSTMRFLFDFGARWRFMLRLERIEPPDMTWRGIKLLESDGQPPVQYPIYEG